MVSRLLGCQRRKKIHSTSKTTVVRWRHHLLYRQILRLLLRRYKDANLIALTLTQTNIINHTGCSYGYKVVCCYDDTNSKPVQIYREEDAIRKFMQEMLKEVEYCRKTISTKFKKPIQMTDEKEILLRQVEQCHICGQKYKEMEKEIRVRDHCHITGCTAEVLTRTVL